MALKDNLFTGDILLIYNKNNKINNDIYFFYGGEDELYRWERQKKLFGLRKQKKFEKVKFSALDTLKGEVRVFRYQNSTKEWQKKLEEFLKHHDYDSRVIDLIIKSMNFDSQSNMRKENNKFKTNFLEELPKLVPHLDKIDSNEYEERWERLLSNAEPGDLLFTTNPNSIISKIITKVTKGPWSHVGIIIEDGYILEMLTSGLEKRPIEVYKDGNSRVGLYKLVDSLTPEQINKIKEKGHSEYLKQPKYGYFTCLKLGILNILGFKAQPPSPMDLVYGGQIRLDSFV